MEDKNLEVARNMRIKSICSHMENKKYEIIAKVGLALSEKPQPTNLLSHSAMNFLLGTQYVEFLDKTSHLQHSVDVAKYIKKNSLLPNIDKVLTQKYPYLSYVRRLVLAVNVCFNEGRQPQTLFRLNQRTKENDRE